MMLPLENFFITFLFGLVENFPHFCFKVGYALRYGALAFILANIRPSILYIWNTTGIYGWCI